MSAGDTTSDVAVYAARFSSVLFLSLQLLLVVVYAPREVLGADGVAVLTGDLLLCGIVHRCQMGCNAQAKEDDRHGNNRGESRSSPVFGCGHPELLYSVLLEVVIRFCKQGMTFGCFSQSCQAWRAAGDGPKWMAAHTSMPATSIGTTHRMMVVRRLICASERQSKSCIFSSFFEGLKFKVRSQAIVNNLASHLK